MVSSEKELKIQNKIESKLIDAPLIFKQYYDQKLKNSKSLKTIDVYFNTLLKFYEWIKHKCEDKEFYNEVNENDINHYMNELKNTVGVEHQKATWSTLNTFFEWLTECDYISVNPMSMTERPKGKVNANPILLQSDSIYKLFDIINDSETKFFRVRNKAIIALLISGLRPSEIEQLRLEDYDFTKDALVIRNRNNYRKITLGDTISSYLCDWVSIREDDFFDVNSDAMFISQKKNNISTDAIADIVEKYGDKLCINKLTPQDIRATTICSLIKKMIPINEIAQYLGMQVEQCLKYVQYAFVECDYEVEVAVDELVPYKSILW